MIMNKKYYAGIGSRQTTPDILVKMQEIAKFLAKKGYILRSGGAEGADKSFEIGCDAAGGEKEIYLPWKGFNENKSQFEWTKAGWDLASEFHPNWDNLKLGARQMMARNSHQILGLDLNTPVEFVVCYTEGGKGGGGTGQSLRIAREFKIEIFDLGSKTGLTELRKYCKKLK
jgi:hypothetical protein